MIEFVTRMAQAASEGRYHFSPVDLFNETWLMRLVLEWFAEHKEVSHPWAFLKGSDWYSEAILPSPFLPRHRRDVLAEGHVRVDAVIGQFEIEPHAGLLRLNPGSNQFLVLLSTLKGQLVPGTTNVLWFDHIARTVAAMAKTISNAEINLGQLDRLGLYLVSSNKVPYAKRDFPSFAGKDHIATTLKRRVSLYRGTLSYDQLQEWTTNCFEPALSAMTLGSISWEEVIPFVCQRDPATVRQLPLFYKTYLDLNLRAGAFRRSVS